MKADNQKLKVKCRRCGILERIKANPKIKVTILLVVPLLIGMFVGTTIAYALNRISEPMFLTQIVSAFIVSIGNFAGLYLGFRRIESKIDKKVEQYTNKFRDSKEGTTFLEVMSDVEKLLKSEESKQLLEGLTEAMKELRSFLKQLRERASRPEETEEEEDVLPTLKKKKKT